MNWHILRELVPHALWAAIGATAAVAFTFVRNWYRGRGQAAVLSGLEEARIFVFPPRPSDGSTILPRMAIEDFLAINNVISAYLNVEWTPPSKIRDSDRLSAEEKRHNDLILICSSKSNSVTKEAIDELRSRNRRLHDLIPYFESDPDANGQIRIRWNKGVYPSASYEQERRNDPNRDDIAIIMKVVNPWAGQHKILVVAGIRGIGTWGAAEFLKKWWGDLYSKKGHSRKRGITKDGDFVALIAVHYQDHDIKSATLLHVTDLEPAYFGVDD